MEDRRRPDWGPGGKLVTDGMLAGQAKIIDGAADVMLRGAPAATRFVLKRIPSGPGYLIDGLEFFQAKDRLRKAASVVGGMAGGAAGGLLGAATGPAAPIGVPLGAAVGSATGQHIAEEIYDENSAAAHRLAEKGQRLVGDSINNVARGLEATKAWMHARNNQVARNSGARP